MSLFFLLPTGQPTVHTPVGGSVISLPVGSSQSAGIRFNTDGTVDMDEGSGYSQYTGSRTWITPTTGFTASEWEVECATNSGSGVTLNNEDDGFHGLGSGFTFEDTFVSGFHNASWLMTVREIADTANTVTFTFTVSAEL